MVELAKENGESDRSCGSSGMLQLDFKNSERPRSVGSQSKIRVGGVLRHPEPE